MFVCPACSFEEHYNPGFRVGTFRPCPRCGLFSLLYLCDQCRNIGLRKSTMPTVCSCGKTQSLVIKTMDETLEQAAGLVGVGTFLSLWFGYMYLETDLMNKGFSEQLNYLLSEGRLLNYGLASIINAGLAWVVALIVCRAMGRKFTKELSDSIEISNNTNTATKVEPVNYATPKKSTPIEPAPVKDSFENWFSTQSKATQEKVLLLVRNYVRQRNISGGYAAKVVLLNKNRSEWNFEDHSRFDEFDKADELARKAIFELDPEGGEDLAFDRLLEISCYVNFEKD